MTQRIPDVTGLDLRAAAVAYAEAGLFIGPTGDDKRPGTLLGKGWQHKTSNDPAVVAGWFEGKGQEGWYVKGAPITGIFLHVGRSGLICFDVDHPEVIPEPLHNAERDTGPATQLSRENSEKRHLIWRTDLDLGNSPGALGKGWGDVRGRNGVIILEPTPHSVSDGWYRWRSHEIPDLPEFLAGLLTRKPAPDPFTPATAGLHTPVPLGRRDEEMFRYACHLRRLDLSREEAMALMRVRAEAFENADGRVTDGFLAAKLDNAWQFPAGKRPEFDADGLEGSPGGPDPSFWSARPELAHVYAFAVSRRVAPWAVLGVTLARVLCAVPPTVVLPPVIGARASLNTFVALAGGSGDSKTTSAEASFDAVLIDGEDAPIPLGSGEGIAAMFVQFIPKTGRGEDAQPARYEQYRSRAFVEVDEIATMGAIGQRGGSTLGDALRRAWSGRILGNHNRAADTRLIVAKHAYRLCLWAGVQPSAAGILLNPIEEGLGTPQRFLWMRAKRDVGQEAGVTPDPLQWSLPPLPGGAEDSFADEEGWSWEVALCDAAIREIIEADTARASGDESEALNGHMLLCRTKVAVALALFAGRWAVDDEDWKLSGLVMEHSNACRSWLKGFMAKAAAEESKARGHAKAAQEVTVAEALENHSVTRVAKRVVKLLQAGPATRAELSRSVAGRDRQYLDPALELLGDRLDVTTERGGATGQTRTLFRLKP